MILPAVSLGLIQMALTARMVRSSMLEVLREDYIRTARAKGMSGRVIVLRHALRNALNILVDLAYAYLDPRLRIHY